MKIIARLFLLLSFFTFSESQASVSSYLHQIQQDPHALYLFFKKMPKGGELHYHLAGGPYAETMLNLASSSDYCLNTTNFNISKNNQPCEGVNIKELQKKPELYEQVIRAWSLKDFIPLTESNHDHFFNSFIKFIPLVFDYRSALLANIMKRAADQQEQYLEVMDITDNGKSSSFGDLLNNKSSYVQKRELLLANQGFEANINYTVENSERVIKEAEQLLNCQANPQSEPCRVKIKLLYYVLREQPEDQFFANALNAFEAASRSKGAIVGVNLVQPENGFISLRDYRKQMELFAKLHEDYPSVNITLHAGELAQTDVASAELKFHIHDAIFTGKAQRIGHGTAIRFEDEAEKTIDYMAKNHLPVEINLISNAKILGVSGSSHPLNYYLSHHVPVILSTDDEGILRTDLTSQYVEAVLKHSLDYETLKQINRNTLTYSFLSGKSIWGNADTQQLVRECIDLSSRECKQFIKDSEKAQLQWNLEQKLIAWEKSCSSK